MMVSKKETITYVVELTEEQVRNLVSAIVTVDSEFILPKYLEQFEFEVLHDLRVSLLNSGAMKNVPGNL